MPKLNIDALAFAIAWAALAVAGGIFGGWVVGAALSAGLLLVIMPISAFVLGRGGNLAIERQIRWALLLLGAIALLVGVKFGG